MPDTTPGGSLISRDQSCLAERGVQGIHQCREGYGFSHGAWRDNDVSAADYQRPHTPEGFTNPPAHPVPADRTTHAPSHCDAQPDPAIV